MMPQQLHDLATERARDRQRAQARHPTGSERPIRRPHRASVRCGYWLISLGCRLVAPDLSAAAN